MIASSSRRTAHQTRLRTVAPPNFTNNDVMVAVSYLTNPTKVGIWRLECDWRFKNGISLEIATQIRNKVSDLKSGKKKIQLSESQTDELVERTETLSFYLRLFAQLLKRHQAIETYEEYLRSDDADELIFSLLNLDDLAAKYKEALSYYEENIYVEGLVKVSATSLAIIKNGSFLALTGPKDVQRNIQRSERQYYYSYSRHSASRKRKIELISLQAAPLEQVSAFFQLLDKVSNCERYAVFSPEEELLSPYVAITSSMLGQLIASDSMYNMFRKMLGDYENDNYTGCISTAGLVTEECLTQIYETLYRSPAPQQIMLGELRHKIGEITKQLRSPTKSQKNISKEDVVALLKKVKSDKKDVYTGLVSSGRMVLDHVDERYQKLDARIKILEGHDIDLSLFPKVIKLNIDSVIRFRNAVSHKFTDPVGSFEALKSIYCSLSLVMWWDKQRRSIDWEKENKDVINQLVEAAHKQDTATASPSSILI